MSWEALGAFAELIGAAGVIGSLLYLAAQVRTSNRASAVQAKLESTRLLNDFMDLLITHPELNQLMLKARKGLDLLAPDEYQQFSNMSLKAFWFFSAGHFQFRRHTLAESDWFEVQAVLDYWLRSQGCKDWWETLGRSMAENLHLFDYGRSSPCTPDTFRNGPDHPAGQSHRRGVFLFMVDPGNCG
jgi:hypothetical protein